MALSDIAHEIWAAAQLAPREGIEDGVARVVVLLDAEVRKQDETLIRQLVEALEDFDYDKRIAAIAAGRARLKGKP